MRDVWGRRCSLSVAVVLKCAEIVTISHMDYLISIIHYQGKNFNEKPTWYSDLTPDSCRGEERLGVPG